MIDKKPTQDITEPARDRFYRSVNSFWGSFRQLWCTPKFRIAAPGSHLDLKKAVDAESATSTSEAVPTELESHDFDGVIAEIATCLWDIERKLRPAEKDKPKRKHRLAYRRVGKAIDALKSIGVEINDPTGERYPQGGEHWMRPIQLQPTPGLTSEKVTETIVPIIYWGDRLIKAGEVFVAVPVEPNAAPGTPELRPEPVARESIEQTDRSSPLAEHETGDQPLKPESSTDAEAVIAASTMVAENKQSEPVGADPGRRDEGEPEKSNDSLY